MTAVIGHQPTLALDAAPPVKVLRPYQQKGVTEILACLQRGVKGTLYSLPTAGGKTVVLSDVVRDRAAADWEIWIFVHRRELLHQTSRMLEAASIDHGIIAPGHPVTSDRVQVASIDTIGARLAQLAARLATVRLAIMDEAHHVVAGKWRAAISAMPNALLVGVTATPFRYDGKGLGDFFQQALKGPGIRELVAQGYLAPACVYAPPNKLDLRKVKTRMGDYAVNELRKLVDTDELTASAVFDYVRICPGKPAIVFCVDVEHTHHVAAAFRAAGWASAGLDGSMPTHVRDRAIRELATGKLQILTSCEIISEGTDIPVVTAAILLRPTKSTGLYLQQVGRAMRLYPGKTHAIIIDKVGNVQAHGMPDEERRWSLSGGLKGMERVVTATKRCRTCHHVCAQGPESCPACGKAYPKPRAAVVSVPAADLRAMGTVAGIPAERIATMNLNALLLVAKTEADLRKIAAIKGYRPGWVNHVLADRAAGYRRFG